MRDEVRGGTLWAVNAMLTKIAQYLYENVMGRASTASRTLWSNRSQGVLGGHPAGQTGVILVTAFRSQGYIIAMICRLGRLVTGTGR